MGFIRKMVYEAGGFWKRQYVSHRVLSQILRLAKGVNDNGF